MELAGNGSVLRAPYLKMRYRSRVSAPLSLNFHRTDLRTRLLDRWVRSVEELLGDEIDARVARLGVRLNEAGVDPFGFDPSSARYALAASAFLHRLYFRTEVSGLENLPSGRTLFIANHSGQVPIDGLMLGATLMLDAEPPRFPRSMVERWSATLPFISVFFPRVGQVIGSPENARRLLLRDEALVVFPEGIEGISKTWRERYKLRRFGLGFMRLALETQTPIVPVSIIGAEEQYPSFGNLRALGKSFGLPALPLLPQLLFGMPLPLPTKYRIRFGQPMYFSGDPDDDESEIETRVEHVRSEIQAMLNEGLAKRRSVFF